MEPPFGNINTTKGLRQFSLRGKAKVNAQWLMFCMVHNIEKIQRYGQAV
ncbi:transposase [Pelagibaculum spongiae]|nr:transposase [Pelagibaculum spongiae]